MFKVVLAQLEQLALRLPEVVGNTVLRFGADEETWRSVFVGAHVGEERLA